MTFISYAQNLEDVLLWRALAPALGEGEAGFYIDVGAWHPDADSATRALYDRGWHGINVEPVPEIARRLRAARPRDVTLDVALGEAPGRARLYVVDGTGLSTLDEGVAARHRAAGYAVEAVEVEVETLAAVCARHALGEIHALKVDVEGAERAVLAGADFARHRPWIVLVEATEPNLPVENHAAWEGILLAAGYRFAWFDGLNRFYVADERAAALLPYLQAPPNVWDDFVRAADGEWARRIYAAETEAAVLRDRIDRAEHRARVAEERAERAVARVGREAALTADAERRYAQERREVSRLHREVAWRHDKLEGQDAQLRRLPELERDAAAMRAWLDATLGSTSWRVTAPLRRATALAGKLRGRAETVPATPSVPSPTAPARALPPPAPDPAPPIRAVHQFHDGSATGDAITNAMLLTRRILRGMGYRSEIFVRHRDPAFAEEMGTLDELPRHAGYVLLVRHSMGHEVMDRILALPAPKVLIYHNITPPEHLWHLPHHQGYARLGREQLVQLRPRVSAALADSEYNALELRALGFDPVKACPLLFDGMALLRAATLRPGAPAREGGAPFTVLFVGRLIESKGQAELVEAFARFSEGFAAPARLVLVGRHGGERDPYYAALREAVGQHGIADQVVFTGPVSDGERDAWYAAADLYVSLSQHEGFGVPLVEAMAHGVPVLAWPAGAVAETLGDAAVLLGDTAPSAVAAEMLALAKDPARRAAMTGRGRQAVAARFVLDRHVPKLVEAVVRAGAAPPPDPRAREALAAGLRFAVAGHVNGTYSLAAINRALAQAVERERPGAVRLLPVEGEPTSDLSGVPPAERREIAALAGRPAPAAGPEVVVSQHYPLYVAHGVGDLALALFFWEESAVPAETVATLDREFRGVLAPSSFVAKALMDSGVSRPVRVLGQAPPLAPFRALAEARRRAPRPTGPTTFLHVSSCFPRKGVDALLAAYARAFRRGDPVRLVVKGFPNPHNDVADQLARLRAADPDLAEVELVDEDLDEAALLALYRDADAVVLPTRGEGYNLPAAEAMAAGLPLIVTGFGGHMDFLGPEEARLVDYAFAASGSHVASAGSVWADPDVDDLARALREVVDDPASARERAARAEQRIARETAPAALVGRLTGAALDGLLAPPAPPIRVAWVSSWAVRCGVAEYSRHLVESLPRDGIAELAVFADERTAPPDAGAGMRVERTWRLGDPACIPPLAAALAAADPDVVVLQHQPGLFPWGLLARLLGERALRARPTVVALHNTRHLLDVDEAHRRAALAALAAVSRVLVHTVADLNRLKALGLVANVALLPHGTPEPLPARAQRPLAPGKDAPLIGCYGFFLPRKGLPELVEALAILRRRWPGARLRLVNARYDDAESDGEIARVREGVARAGLEGAVEFVTEFLPVERSLALLAECDAVALPYQSSLEAASGAVRIALAAGVPVAVTPLPLFDEAAEAVVRLDGTEPDAIARGLDALLADAERRAAVAQAARRWLLARSWAQTGRRLGGMLRGLAESARLPPPDPGQ
jgi:FkbM family methyltransferase